MATFRLVLFLTIACFLSGLHAQTPAGREYHLLIGTYSTKDNPNGIHVFRFNTKNAAFTREQPVTDLSNASYLAVSHDGKNVYAVSEGNGGSVNAYEFNSVSGALTPMNSVPAEGPCYVSVDVGKKLVFAGNYGGGSVLAIHLNADGSFAEDRVQTIQHEGSSTVKGRQDRPHVHSVVLSLDERYLLVPDLGTDRVYLYRVDATHEQALMPADVSFMSVKAGGGPRHLTFHPNGKYAYLVLELEGAVMAFDYNNGKLRAKQDVRMSAIDFKGRVSGADIHVSPDGKFLYASNRGDANEIAIFSIDKQGRLSLAGQQPVLGETPRNFAIDPSGNFLLVANQNSDEVIIFRRDKKTGMLTPTGKRIEVDRPVCLKFAAISN